MKYMKLGNTDIEVSRICVGGMSFGEPSDKFQPWTLNEAETQAMIEHAYNLGVNFIDTANCYSLGTSEIYIGRALKNLGIPRDKVVLASKVYFNEGKLSRKAIHTEIALAWHYAKGVCAPLVGATKARHFDDAVRAVDLELASEDICYLEEPYKPHSIVGALSEEKAQATFEKWTKK